MAPDLWCVTRMSMSRLPQRPLRFVLEQDEREDYVDGAPVFHATSFLTLKQLRHAATQFYYGVYEVLKNKLSPPDGGMSVGVTLLCGGLAGVFNWLVAVPPDTVKSRYQSAPAGKYSGPGQVLKEIMKEGGGIMGTYKGLGPALVRAFPANAACFLGMETTKKLFVHLGW